MIKLLILLIYGINCSTSVFFHERSAVTLKPNSGKTIPSFGFAMGYQKWQGRPRLVVGAPKEDDLGKVYSCDLNDLTSSTILCSYIDMNVDEVAKYNCSVNPKQQFLLGTSIATTPDYFFTCAPLWTDTLLYNNIENRADVYGTCFIKNETLQQYRGTYEYYKNEKRDSDNEKELLDWATGGLGWNLLSDENNGYILISKPAKSWNIFYIPMKNPSEKAKMILKEENYKLEINLNSGYGLAVGNFFSKDITCYAFNTETNDRSAQIFFIHEKDKGELELMMYNEVEQYRIEESEVGSMFGYAMTAGDLNGDGLDELIVGAPAAGGRGAIHIYMGGKRDSLDDENIKRTITGAAEEGRFGQALAVGDIDRDTKTEIFVGAPYEDTGVVYVLSGHEVKEVLLKEMEYKEISVSRLKKTQIIRKAEFKGFGYSLQRVPDVNGNGCDELAVGSPESGAALLVRGLPAVVVEVSLKQVGGTKIVKKTDPTFEVNVCVQFRFKGKEDIIGDIEVINYVTGYKASIVDSTFTIDLSKQKPSDKQCKPVTVQFDQGHQESGKYTFVTKIEQTNYKKLVGESVFNNKWVVLSRNGDMQKTLDILRGCDSEACDPKLSVEVTWSWVSSKDYPIGQSTNETVTIKVRNEGNIAGLACIKLEVRGAALAQAPSCEREAAGPQYTCPMIKPMDSGREHLVHVLLDMAQLSNRDERLQVDVYPFNNCDSPVSSHHVAFKVQYRIPDGCIQVDGSHHDLIVTEKQMTNPEVSVIPVNHVYLINNKCNFKWNEIKVVIKVEKQSLIKTVKVVTETDTYLENGDKNVTREFTYDEILPKSSKKIVVAIDVSKDSLKDIIRKGLILDLESVLTLEAEGLHMRTEKLSSKVSYNKELTVGNNKLAIILIAVVVAVIVILILILILYKLGFFKRNQKRKLDEVRRSLRRRSIRQASVRRESQKHSKSNNDENQGIDMDIEDDCAFEEVPCSSQIETKVKVQ